jgi:hypothetical protein
MKIKKNGVVINLTESDLKKIVRRGRLMEQTNPKDIVISCIIENTSLSDIKNLPEACVKMVVEKDLTKAFECGMSVDENVANMLVKKIEPISKCVFNKMNSSTKS